MVDNIQPVHKALFFVMYRGRATDKSSSTLICSRATFLRIIESALPLRLAVITTYRHEDCTFFGRKSDYPVLFCIGLLKL